MNSKPSDNNANKNQTEHETSPKHETRDTKREDIKSLHWTEIVAQKISKEKKPPFVVLAGITPSGPVHPGTLCEFMYAYAVSKKLEKYGKTEFRFVSDDLDALDSVPEPLKPYEAEILPNMGMALAYAPDPKKCHNNFADHFVSETQKIMKAFGVNVEFLRASDLYKQGKYDQFAKMMCENKDQVKEIVKVSSNRDKMPDEWFPIMPLCIKCKNVDKNVVLSYNKDGSYNYRCNKCNNESEDKIENHNYKLLFRLDWPTRQKFLNVVVEGGSVDHHSPGGTIATLKKIHIDFYKEEPPYMYKFGLLKYKGKKYSKSKGIGHTINEMLELLPEEIIKYILLKSDVEQDKELVIDVETLMPILDEFRRIGQTEKADELHRADHKKIIAYELCDAKKIWNFDVGDAILYYSIYKNWDKVAELVEDKKGVENLKPYMQAWIERKLIPGKYLFEVKMNNTDNADVIGALSTLQPSMTADQVQNAIFEYSKANKIEMKDLFKGFYLAIINQDSGPKLGKLIHAIGIEKVKKALI